MPEDNNELLKKLQKQVQDLKSTDSISLSAKNIAEAEDREALIKEVLESIHASDLMRQAEDKEAWYKQYVPGRLQEPTTLRGAVNRELENYPPGQGLGNRSSGSTGQTSDLVTPKGGYGGGGGQSQTPATPGQPLQAPSVQPQQQPIEPRTSSPPGTPPTPFTLLTPSPTPPKVRPEQPQVTAPIPPPSPPETPQQKEMRAALGDKYDMVKPYLTPENTQKYGSFLNSDNIKKYKDYITPETLKQYLGEPPKAQPQPQPQVAAPAPQQSQVPTSQPSQQVIPKSTQVGKLDFPKMDRPPGSVGALGYPRLHVPWENKQQPQQQPQLPPQAVSGQTPTSTQSAPATLRSSAGVILQSTPADQWLASRTIGVGGTSMEGALKEGYSRKSEDLKLNYSIRSMSPEMRYSMYRLGQAYEKETGKKFFVNSAYRSPLGKGSSMASGRGSMHGGHGAGPGHGVAFDVGGAGGLGNLSPEARDIIAYAQKHPEYGITPKGLHFADAGHLEYSGSRKGQWASWSNEQKEAFNKDYNAWIEEHRKSVAPQAGQQQAQQPPQQNIPPILQERQGTATAQPQVTEKPSVAATQPSGGYRDPENFSLPDREKLPAGMRNQNPGNIKYNKNVPWEGLVGPSKNTDQGDAQAVFQTHQHGMNAAARLAYNKYTRYGMKSADQIIATPGMGWTGGPGTTPHEAAANIAKQMGVGPHDDMHLEKPENMSKFLRALTMQEHGPSSRAYTQEMYDIAARRATGAKAVAGTVPEQGVQPSRTQAPSVTSIQQQPSQYGVGVMNNLSREDIAARPGHERGQLSVDIPGQEKPELFDAGTGGWQNKGVPPGRYALNPQERASGITRYYQKSGIPTSTENEFGKVYNVGVPSAGETVIPNDPGKYLGGGAGTRGAIQIHAGSDVQRLMSQGCFVVDKSQYPRLVQSIEAVRKANNGKANLIVNYDKDSKKYSFKITGPDAAVKTISPDQAVQNQQSTGDAFGKTAAAPVVKGGISRPGGPDSEYEKGGISRVLKSGDINRPEKVEPVHKQAAFTGAPLDTTKIKPRLDSPRAGKKIEAAPIEKEWATRKSDWNKSLKKQDTPVTEKPKSTWDVIRHKAKPEPRQQEKFTGSQLDTTKIKPNLDSPRAVNKQAQESAVKHNALPATKAGSAPAQAPHATEAKNPEPKASAPMQRRDTGGLTHNWTSAHTGSSAAASSRVENTFVKPKTGQDHSFSSAGLVNV